MTGTEAVLWVCMIAVFALVTKPGPRDDSDSKTERSGLTIYTDNKTGCQYVKGGLFGGLSVRVDQSGKPICKGE